MNKLHGRIAIFTLGMASAQACGDSTPPDPPPVCNDNDICEDGEESCLDCALCGDGNQDPSEPCDDGNDANDDACVAPCQLARCGDGHLQEGVEVCDDGDDDNSDAQGLVDHCNANCSAVIPSTPSTCGNMVCDPHEDSSTCAEDCFCGNRTVEAGELCDDGLDGSAMCDVNCSDVVCGDGQTNEAADEDCDDGNADDSDDCVDLCKAASCGDGHHWLDADSDEECDDGNQDDTDNCSTDCLLIEHRKVFVTSMSYLGDLGGLDGADAECNAVAMAVGLDGFYRAWLSDSVDGPATRFDIAFAGVYELNDKDSTLVTARGWDGLTKEELQHAINVDENGQEYVTGVWTNTDQAGLPLSDVETCSEWTGVDSDAFIGNSGAVDMTWTVGVSQGCATGFSLYCFQDSM